MTFSIVCADPVTGEMGVAVASFPARVGRAVPLGVPGVGVVAIQGCPGPHLRGEVLNALCAGASPVQALELALGNDAWRNARQALVMDARGGASSWTGENCKDPSWWAGSLHGDGWTAAGNNIASEGVVQGMGAAFQAGIGLPAEWRLLNALKAGHAAGGDQRGIRSAAVMVMRPSMTNYIVFEVDESADPLGDLERKMRGETVKPGRPLPPDRADRSDAELEEAEAEILATARGLVATNDKVALSYSGGAESGLLLHLLRPLRQKLVAVWVNPGVLPHNAEHVRRQMQGGPCVEVKGDREAFWRDHGIPARIMPMERMTIYRNDVPMKGPPISSEIACCSAVRTAPGQLWCMNNGVTLMIHGQRRGEGTTMFNAGLAPAHWGALAEWTRGEVMRRVAFHGVPLPFQYAEGCPKSMECAACPADTDPERLGFLKRFYPEAHAETVRLARQAMNETAAILERERAALEAAA